MRSILKKEGQGDIYGLSIKFSPIYKIITDKSGKMRKEHLGKIGKDRKEDEAQARDLLC